MAKNNPTSTRKIAPSLDSELVEDRKPRRAHLFGDTPKSPSFIWPLVLALVALTPAALFAPLPRPADIILTVLGVAIAAGLVWRIRAQSQDPNIAWIRAVTFSADAVGFNRDLVVAAGPQLVVARMVDAAPLNVSRTGEVRIGGKPLHRVAPAAEAKALAKTAGAQEADVVVAVDDRAGAVSFEPTAAPLSRRQIAVVVPLSLLGSTILSLPDRLDADASPTDLVSDFVS